MDTRKVVKEYRLSCWAELVQEYKDSGLSKKAFCESIGMHENTFYYRQKKVREAVCNMVMVKPQEEQLPTVKEAAAVAPKGWAVCKAAEPVNNDKVLPIEISGCRVLAGVDVDPQLLATVCRVLVTL